MSKYIRSTNPATPVCDRWRPTAILEWSTTRSRPAAVRAIAQPARRADIAHDELDRVEAAHVEVGARLVRDAAGRGRRVRRVTRGSAAGVVLEHLQPGGRTEREFADTASGVHSTRPLELSAASLSPIAMPAEHVKRRARGAWARRLTAAVTASPPGAARRPRQPRDAALTREAVTKSKSRCSFRGRRQ